MSILSVYSDTFRIFHDPLGGDQFGLLWDPALKEPKSFKVMNKFSSVPWMFRKEKVRILPGLIVLFPKSIFQENVDGKSAAKTAKSQSKDKDLVVLNEEGVLSEIERMGKGLVKRITLHASK